MGKVAKELYQIKTLEEAQKQTELLRRLTEGMVGDDLIDSTYKAMLTGTNTTAIFYTWWPLSNNGEDSKYQRLERFARMLAAAWSGKTYTLRGYAGEVSGDTALTPLDDLAGRNPGVLATDTDGGGEDWTEEDPMTWYVRANALSLEDGTMDVVAIEGEDGFDISGEIAPVYCFALALWQSRIDDGSYEISSWRTTAAPGYAPYAGDVGPDNKKRALTWHPAFGGGLTDDGKLTSGAGRKPYTFAAATTGLAAARKWEGGNDGLWTDCDTEWLLDMWKLRHFDKENSNKLEGCLNYNAQPTVALAETGVRRVLLTQANAKNFIVGSTVSVGDPAEQTNYDRYNTYMRNIADLVRITSIADVTVNGTVYSAVNLDVAAPITTTATTRISTMPWYSGNTERLPGHRDGCTGSLTAGKTPARIAGVEVLDGAYVIGLDPLYNVTANPAGGFDYAVHTCRDSKKQAGSITADYIDTGIRLSGVPSGWSWVKAFFVNAFGVLFPRLFGGSSSSWYKSAFYGTDSAGVRCPWRFGNLNNGGNGGLAYENGNNAPGNLNWNGRPRLSVGVRAVSILPHTVNLRLHIRG